MSKEDRELLLKLQHLADSLRLISVGEYNRINPFMEDVVNWKAKGLLAGTQNSTIYDSTTVVGDVTIGYGTWIGPFCSIDGTGGLEIGEYCDISAGVQIQTHDTVKRCLSGGNIPIECAPVKIGNNCFIGVHVVILKGVIIGNHCVVGAGAVVTKSFPDNSIIAGVPAKRIGVVRFKKDGSIKLQYDKT